MGRKSTKAVESSRATPRRSSRTAVRSRAAKPTSLLLRDIPADVLAVLRARAARAGRSLQQELHVALRRDVHRNFADATRVAAAWHERLAGRKLPAAVDLIREDRTR